MGRVHEELRRKECEAEVEIRPDLDGRSEIFIGGDKGWMQGRKWKTANRR